MITPIAPGSALRGLRAGIVAAMLGIVAGSAALGQSQWWNTAWRYRVPVSVTAGAYDRFDKPAEMDVNFTDALSSLGTAGPFDENSLRVIEVTAGGLLLDSTVAFQFDRAAGYDASTNAAGTLVFILKGTTTEGSTRYYHVYFETTGSGVPAGAVPPQVVLTDDVDFEGQLSYRIESASTTWYYHKKGGGYAGMRDRDGLEWLGYHPTGGSGGSYRGIPNMVFDINGSDFFHPGFTNSTSTVISAGPVRVTFRTKSDEPLDPWECVWDVFPGYARMTLVGRGRAGYWFLYEGTPGGSFNGSNDYVVRSTAERNLASQSWEGDVPSPEWVYFGDSGLKRTLFVANHEADSEPDSYRQQEDLMTVFGFGRTLNDLFGYMQDVPRRFTVGFVEDSAFTPTSKAIASAFRDIIPSRGTAERFMLGTPLLLSPSNGSLSVPLNAILRWTRVSGAGRYHLQVATDSTFASGFAVNDSSLIDTSRLVSGLQGGASYFWRVRAAAGSTRGPFSGVWRFTSSQNAPELKQPADGASLPGNSILFAWGRIPGAAAYHLQVALDPLFQAGMAFNDSTLTDTSRTVTALPGGTRFYWRAGAKIGTSFAYSSGRTFVTTLAPPELLFPARNSEGQPTAITFRWRSVAGAARYVFELATDSTFNSGIVKNDTMVTDTSRYVAGLTQSVSYFWRVSCRDNGGIPGAYSETWRFRVGSTGVNRETGLPSEVFLDQNYPNPFNPSTIIRFGVPTESHVRLDIYTVLGERLATLLDEPLGAGVYSVPFRIDDRRGVSPASSSGVYFCRLSVGSDVRTRKMLILK